MYSPGLMMDDQEVPDTGRLTVSLEDNPTLRYVAGDKFFNYQQYGALRGGGEVTLFSREYYGLLIGTIPSAVVYAIMRYCIRTSLMNSLELQRTESSAIIECIISLPTSFSLFAGIFSDIFPIAHYRRKSYIVLGSAITFVMLIGLMVLAFVTDPAKMEAEDRGDYIIYYMLLIMGTMFGTLINKISTDARVIELSQREPLTNRGHIQINYLIFRSLMECLSSWATAFLINYDPKTKNYHLKVDQAYVYLALAIISLLVIPFVLMNCVEQSVEQNEADLVNNLMAAGVPVSSRPMSTPAMRIRAFFRMCQQRAVWQIVLFLSLVLATTRFYFATSDKAFKSLTKTDANTSLRTSAIKFMVNIAVLIGWKVWWSNASWRRTVAAGLFALIGIETFRALMMLYVPSTRTQLFLDSMSCIMAISDAVISIFSFIPATEIAEYGSEGATIGLLQSFRSCIAVATRTLGENLDGVAASQLKSPPNIGTLCLLLMITYGVHAISFSSLCLLPRQKLDAQQLRVYGGYSKMACGVLIIIFLGFFSFSTTVNLIAMVDMAKGSSG
ncbi:hypothetical protein Poli38472_010036 [Pythium oligandrum]|uniref:Transmembrane protein n=1 Tax=Pythium oligandrum TaxID=41045 RepID=A0A8K1C8F1_PYTOL|nr:hypothetical protein Poli38472_010036 [Pythium oligandrum]|eukprot:TMW58477.1 hypothetical protein Poli38472_010036 [Pythium oligandrum]